MKKIISKFCKKSKLIKKGAGLNLYKTKDGLFFWLNPEKYLDRNIIDEGVFEHHSTLLVKKLLRPSDVVFDVGANIGYYSVLFSKLVGEAGKVYSFEPTRHYRSFLEQNILSNELKNIEVLDFGLSNKFEQMDISIGESSATLHWVSLQSPQKTELITIKKLDDIINTLNLKKINFIKVDVDGHEPFFLQGAINTIEKYDPAVLLEVSHENYLEAGMTAWDFYAYLKENRFHVYSEIDCREFQSKGEFLRECGNFAYSANILISKSDIHHKLNSL